MPYGSKVRPRDFGGICAICAGTAMMPRSAPEHIRVPCAGCSGTGVLA